MSLITAFVTSENSGMYTEPGFEPQNLVNFLGGDQAQTRLYGDGSSGKYACF